MNLIQRWIISAISRYQLNGGGVEKFRVECNFEPTCSEYAKQAIIRYGVVRGATLSANRIRRCSVRDQVSRISDPVPDK